MNAAPMPIIVGAPRSGTTLLRMMLDAHPDLAIPPETGFLAIAQQLQQTPGLDAAAFCDAIVSYPPDAPGWADFGIDEGAFRARSEALDPFTVADGLRAFYALYAERFGKPRWGEKTPTYCLHIEAIASVLAEARFIHVIRDGRDVAVSLRRRWFSPGHAIDVQARFWRDHVLGGREQGLRAAHYLEVRYEDLLHDPEPVLRKVCEFSGLDFDPVMLRYYERSADRLSEHLARHHVDGSLVVGRDERFKQQELTTKPPDTSQIGIWKQGLTTEDAAGFTAIAGDVLEAFGYVDRVRNTIGERSSPATA